MKKQHALLAFFCCLPNLPSCSSLFWRGVKNFWHWHGSTLCLVPGPGQVWVVDGCVACSCVAAWPVWPARQAVLAGLLYAIGLCIPLPNQPSLALPMLALPFMPFTCPCACDTHLSSTLPLAPHAAASPHPLPPSHLPAPALPVCPTCHPCPLWPSTFPHPPLCTFLGPSSFSPLRRALPFPHLSSLLTCLPALVPLALQRKRHSILIVGLPLLLPCMHKKQHAHGGGCVHLPSTQSVTS